MKNLIIETLKKQSDGFIVPNQTEFNNCDIKEFFVAINELVASGVLRKRDCSGVAYEFNL